MPMECIFNQNGEGAETAQSGTPPLDPPAACPTGVNHLPLTLGDAIDAFADSELMKQVLGEHIHGFLVDCKRAEWHEYLGQVTPWELDHNLAVL
jgi:glutamine synthetase